MPVKAKPLRGALRAAYDRRFARTAFKLISVSKNTMSKSSKRVTISVCLALIAFIVSWLAKGFSTGNYEFTTPFVFMAITLTIAQILNIHYRFDDHEEKIIKELKSLNIFSKIGTAEDGLSYIKSKMKDAKAVDNTYLRFRDYSAFDDNMYPENWHDEIPKIVEQFCISGKRWRDVISKGQKRDGAVLKIMSNPKIRSYSAKIIDDSPVINYIILHYENEKEVLFGWATIKDYPSHTLVWSTKQTQLTEYFAHHFNMLFNSGFKGETI
jgi:hypothetical protein